jgi:hypothetical protein
MHVCLVEIHFVESRVYLFMCIKNNNFTVLFYYYVGLYLIVHENYIIFTMMNYM